MAYRMTDETMTMDGGEALHRIEATEDFGDVHAGDRGGWIENASNFTGNAWVGGEAMILGSAAVRDGAHVLRDVHVGLFFVPGRNVFPGHTICKMP